MPEKETYRPFFKKKSPNMLSKTYRGQVGREPYTVLAYIVISNPRRIFSYVGLDHFISYLLLYDKPFLLIIAADILSNVESV